MKKQHCVVMDEELSQELKIVAIKEGMSMSDLISKACVDYLNLRKQLVDRGIIFDDVRDMKQTLNIIYGTEASNQNVSTHNYITNDNTKTDECYTKCSSWD